MTFIKLFYSDIDNIDNKNYRCQFSGLKLCLSCPNVHCHICKKYGVIYE